ncbi:MAG: phosphonate ABC transporter ATP-binding protein [Acidimicrobiia bacterium]
MAGPDQIKQQGRGDASAEPTVRVENLVKVFDQGAVEALRGISFEVMPASLTVLVGRSGSGKSTLLRTINGLERPTSGRVVVFGQVPAVLAPSELRRLRRRIGFVFQSFNLVGRAMALENVLSGALGRLKAPRYGPMTYSNTLRKEALEQLDRVGVADKAFQRADTLSGGQQQRVAIARMLFQKPDLVLADEPVASLDPESSRQVMELLFACCAESNLTVICSLHQMDLAMGWADRVIGMRLGQIVLDRPASGLTSEETMAVYDVEEADDSPPADKAP